MKVKYGQNSVFMKCLMEFNLTSEEGVFLLKTEKIKFNPLPHKYTVLPTQLYGLFNLILKNISN